MRRWLVFLWRSRWGLLRLGVACFVAWVLAVDSGARVARMAMAQLPDFDYAGEVASLRAQGRYGEALVIADAGLERTSGAQRRALDDERTRTIDEQASWLRRARDLGWGALSGRGETLESLIGAVTADFFVVGDIRDLVVQGANAVTGRETDEVVLVLSVVGVVTTLAPEIDWVPSVLKGAERTGRLSKAMGEFLVRAVRGKRMEELREVLTDVRRVAEHASPGGAMRAMRFAEGPADLKRLAGFLERERGGAAALHIGGEDGARLLREGTGAVEHGVVLAAEKGRAGVRLLASPAGRALLRPHPLVGLLKAVWKGNATDLLTRALDRVDPQAWWLLPAACGWAAGETVMLWWRWRTISGRRSGRSGPARSGG